MSVNKRIFEAFLDEMHLITILLPKTYNKGISKHFTLLHGELSWELDIQQQFDLGDKRKYVCYIPTFLKIGEMYCIQDEHGQTTDLQIGAVIRTKAFDDAFFYSGNDLGVTYRDSGSTFKIWAPTATAVSLKLLNHTDNEIKTVPMDRGTNGVWETYVAGDLEKIYYSFLICVNSIWNEAVDPYAKAVSVNGEFGVIIDLSKTTVDRHILPPLQQTTDAIIYEMNIRDFSIHPDSGIKDKGKYTGLVEINTKNKKDGTITGLSYLIELGVTHIELLPVNDFFGINEEKNDDLEYNWGYNPLHFNAPEGSYSTNPNDPYKRIIELKKSIQDFHKAGLKVILDVVYNHVYIREESSFEKIVPGYYFRHDENGMPSNGTGVGNDIASERAMVSKFIVDSVRYWLTEYDVDGFRFDLMGILDVNTMNAVRRAIDEINPSVILFGEGWDLNTPLKYEEKAIIRNNHKLPRIALFNDLFRDTVKGSTFNLYDRGFSLGNVHKYHDVKHVICGSVSLTKGEKSLVVEPIQTINYVESHDNHTFWDKMAVCNGHENEEVRMKRQRLATTLVLLSQGIPFLHAGQEFFRTKNGIENSYNSPNHINWLDWARKSKYSEEVNYVKGLIALRKYHGAFRFSSASLVRKHLQFLTTSEEGVVSYVYHNVGKYGTWDHIFVAHNAQPYEIEITLPKSGIWHAVCDEQKAGKTPIYSILGNIMTIKSISTVVLYQLSESSSSN
ncbi:type I pullulanase [Bacillus timonensis]|nr:type I pullulanase [Bacillus timonensis]